MCNDKEMETTEEIQVLFSDDIEIFEARLADIIIAMGLPEEQANSVLRLIDDAMEDHHANILDTFEHFLEDAANDEVAE
jgi:signal transduction protein with GAF and PtsI domain